jgi:hypothetical protein
VLLGQRLHHVAQRQQTRVDIGRFFEPSGNIQGTFREYSGNTQGTFSEHSGNIQGELSGHP